MADIEKVIKALEECVKYDYSCNKCPYKPKSNNEDEEKDCSIELTKDALELLKEQPHWIPAEERLPKSMINKVIVYVQHKDLASRIGFGHFEKYHGVGTWWDLERDEPFIKHGFTVTHWMPIPKSPYGEELILS